MQSSGQTDWAGKILGFFFGMTILMGGTMFLLDRCQATFTPNQYAAEKAQRAAEERAVATRAAEQQEITNAAQAVRDEAQRKEALTYELASSALQNFKSSLRDPSGARFRDVWAVKGQLNGTEIVAACGVVNAPNAFGGYVGETPFMAAASLIYTPDHPSFAGLFKTICLDGEKMMKLN